MQHDVIVVGGGLAGSAAAIALRRRGLSVAVIDKAEFPRDKPCGEGLLPHGLELLDALGCGDVVSRCGGQPFRGILYRCHGVVARGEFEGGQTGRGVSRLLLDDAMRAHADAAGASLVRGTVTHARVDDDATVVTTSDGAVRSARFVIGADGPRSTVRHALALDGGAPSRPRYAMRRHYRMRSAHGLAHVEVNVVSGYELYVTPIGTDVVGVAALCEKQALHDVIATGGPEQRMDALVARCAPVADRLRDAIVEGRTLACGPLRVRSKDVAVGAVFLVGDAAGYVDAITGEGMSLGLKTALLAADAIADTHAGKLTLAAARDRYRRLRARAFRDHALLTFGLVELARHPFFAKRAIARLAKEPALFTRLLAVNNGTRALTSLGVLDFVKLAVGARPQHELGGAMP